MFLVGRRVGFCKLQAVHIWAGVVGVGLDVATSKYTAHATAAAAAAAEAATAAAQHQHSSVLTSQKPLCMCARAVCVPAVFARTSNYAATGRTKSWAASNDRTPVFYDRSFEPFMRGEDAASSAHDAARPSSRCSARGLRVALAPAGSPWKDFSPSRSGSCARRGVERQSSRYRLSFRGAMPLSVRDETLQRSIYMLAAAVGCT